MVISLALTMILELLAAAVVGLRGRDLLLTVIVNLLTNPIVTAFFYILSGTTELPVALIKAFLEISAIVAEWLIYRKYGVKIKRPLLLSVGLNGFSFFSGMLINHLI
ncbi:MAG: hypothetical protein J5999_08915 [Oscillospiraceae bacterium]|nr:hypothetical protein [Oscillospiraceae bacterium]